VCDAFIHESESAHGLNVQLSNLNLTSCQGRMQLYTLQMW